MGHQDKAVIEGKLVAARAAADEARRRKAELEAEHDRAEPGSAAEEQAFKLLADHMAEAVEIEARVRQLEMELASLPAETGLPRRPEPANEAGLDEEMGAIAKRLQAFGNKDEQPPLEDVTKWLGSQEWKAHQFNLGTLQQAWDAQHKPGYRERAARLGRELEAGLYALAEQIAQRETAEPRLFAYGLLSEHIASCLQGIHWGSSLPGVEPALAERYCRQLDAIAQLKRDHDTHRATGIDAQRALSSARHGLANCAAYLETCQRRLALRLWLLFVTSLFVYAVLMFLGFSGVLPQAWTVALGIAGALWLILWMSSTMAHDTLRAEVRNSIRAYGAKREEVKL